MSFLTPLFLSLGLLAGPIILLYMLRLRRQEVLVSSTMLWQQLMRDREANAPWQKLRRNLLLILQLLILALLVLALARPFIPVPSVVSGSVVVLLDASASMQATDIEPSRFDAAKVEVERLISELGGDSQMTLIKAGLTPTVLTPATNDRTALRQALATTAADAGRTNWAATFALAAGAVQGFNDARIILVSDGGLPNDLPPLPAELLYLPIGTSRDNLAINALATRNTDTGPQLFASIRNAGTQEQTALLSITRNGQLFDSRRLTMPPQANTNATWQLPADTNTIQAHLSDYQSDFLAIDNVAWAVHEGGVNNRALLVTEGNLFLEQIYTILPGIDAFKIAPDSELLQEDGGVDSATTEAFDLYILDGVPIPTNLPPTDMLLINPPRQESELIDVTGSFSNTVAIRLDNNPMLQFVDWRNIHIQQAKSVTAPWAQSLVDAEGGPLLLVGERNGRRIAILTFDLRQSDLPLQIAFPVLMANITNWLNPGRAFDAPTSIPPGDPINITPGTSTTAVSVQKPDETLWRTSIAEETAILFAETTEPGLYQINLQDSSGQRAAGRFAVNLFDPTESDITPVTTIQVGQLTVNTAEAGNVGQREFWPWLLTLALIVLLIEWWVHHRGVPTIHRKS